MMANGVKPLLQTVTQRDMLTVYSSHVPPLKSNEYPFPQCVSK